MLIAYWQLTMVCHLLFYCCYYQVFIATFIYLFALFGLFSGIIDCGFVLLILQINKGRTRDDHNNNATHLLFVYNV